MSRGWVERHPVLTAALVVVALVGLITLGQDEDPPGTTDTGQGAADSGGTSPARHKNRQERGDTRRPRPRDDKPRPDQPAPRPRTYLVVRVVDGDTVQLGNGETVRLVGIDAPEVGECGYEQATEALADLVLDRDVRLTIFDEDRDQYGRLLRYVDIAAVDAGLQLIERGLAVAKYDSRDGYGYHPRQARYIAADSASHDVGCAKPAPLMGSAGGGCAAGYRPCVPTYPPDLDCGDVDGPVYVTGSDPHGLDADGDGVACEWG